MLIEQADAANAARATMMQFLDFQNAGSAWSPLNFPEAGVDNWFGGSPVCIYDIDGSPLFYDFEMELSDGFFSRVRTAADSTLGSPAVQVSLGPKVDYASLVSAIRQTIEPTYTLHEQLVCYSYPKLGVLVTDRMGRTFVVDLFDRSMIHLEPVAASVDALGGEFVTAWSLLSVAKRASSSLVAENFRMRNALVENLFRSDAGLEASVLENLPLVKQKVLPNVPLRPQSNSVFCAIATAQMILERWNIIRSQEDIAVAMGTRFPPDSGTRHSAQVTAYSTLSGGVLQGRSDSDPTFSEACAQIDIDRPLKSGIVAHARCCVGYKSAEGPNGPQQWLLINDPWPSEQGNQYWEDWNQIVHTNFISVGPPQ